MCRTQIFSDGRCFSRLFKSNPERGDEIACMVAKFFEKVRHSSVWVKVKFILGISSPSGCRHAVVYATA